MCALKALGRGWKTDVEAAEASTAVAPEHGDYAVPRLWSALGADAEQHKRRRALVDPEAYDGVHLGLQGPARIGPLHRGDEAGNGVTLVKARDVRPGADCARQHRGTARWRPSVRLPSSRVNGVAYRHPFALAFVPRDPAE